MTPNLKLTKVIFRTTPEYGPAIRTSKTFHEKRLIKGMEIDQNISMTPQPRSTALRTSGRFYPEILFTFFQKLLEINMLRDYHRTAFLGVGSEGGRASIHPTFRIDFFIL